MNEWIGGDLYTFPDESGLPHLTFDPHDPEMAWWPQKSICGKPYKMKDISPAPDPIGRICIICWEVVSGAEMQDKYGTTNPEEN